MQALIAEARKKYHAGLLADGVLTIDSKGIPSNADKDSRLSVRIAEGIARRLMAETQAKALGQTAGAKFEQLNMEFLEATFPHLQNLRPGKWHIAKLGNRNKIKTSSFAQYEHLDYLSQLTRGDARLAASMGNDYMVAQIIENYYYLGAQDKAHELAVKMTDDLMDAAVFYIQWGSLGMNEFEQAGRVLLYIADVCKQYGDKELAEKLETSFSALLHSED